MKLLSKKSSLTLAALAAIGLAPSLVHAQTSPATQNIQVTANVQSSCRIVSATDVVFGNVNLLNATMPTVAAPFSVSCNRGATPSVSFNNGLSASGTTRQMAGGVGGAERLSYRLLQPATLTSTDCATPGADWNAAVQLTSLFTASGGARTVQLCGTLEPNQTVSAGSYTDTVVMTLTF
jgi:spore coat protein U-like protein